MVRTVVETADGFEITSLNTHVFCSRFMTSFAYDTKDGCVIKFGSIDELRPGNTSKACEWESNCHRKNDFYI